MTHYYLIVVNGEDIVLASDEPLDDFLKHDWVQLRNQWNINMRLVQKVREITDNEFFDKEPWARR